MSTVSKSGLVLWTAFIINEEE